MERSVEIYIKKNTLVHKGVLYTNNTPYLSIKDTIGGFISNSFIGYYVVINSGVSTNFTSYIDGNTTNNIYLQTAIPVNEGDTYSIYKSEFQRLDLFKDEKINVTAQIQNANDLAKLYTDYSQSFNVPATKKNNAIFSHWYESSVDNGYDHRVRYDGYIEIDTHRYKQGTFQLENAKKKDGFIDSYQLTFYGNLTQLKDIIKDDKLNSLDYTSLNHLYISNQVITRVSETVDALGNPFFVRSPLIGNQKKYQYQTGSTTDDITLPTGAIKWNDLFPAIPLTKVFEFITNKYGITFTGTFLQQPQFRELYLYCKPSLSMSEQTQRIKINLTTYTTLPFPELNLATDVIRTSWDWVPSNAVGDIYNRLKLHITPAVGYTTRIYSVFVYADGNLIKTFSNLQGNKSLTCDTVRRSNNPNPINYELKFSSDTTMIFKPSVTLDRCYGNPPFGTQTITNGRAENPSQSTLANIEIGNYIPDIKISDFITGLIKMFNLMVIPKENNTFEMLPLESYYNQGKIIDITKYVYSEEATIEKPKLFKSINLAYEKSNNVLNVAYNGLYGQQYGDLVYRNENTTENDTYDVKLPFENVLFEVPTLNTKFQTATLVDKDLKPYIPKPMILYLSGRVFVASAGERIYMTNSAGGTQTIETYNRFSNELNVVPTDISLSNVVTLNFGNEQSSWTNELAPNGLYQTNYRNYIENLYNLKTRILKVKAVLPVSLLGSQVVDAYGKKIGISLNDRLIIRNKRYIINSFTTDLTSGEATFELVTDYRGFNASNTIGYRFANVENVEIDNKATKITQSIYLNDYDSFNIVSTGGFISVPVSTDNTSDLDIEIAIPNNTSGVERYDAVLVEYYKDGVLDRTDLITVKQDL
jgi:hypothetical protein